MKNISLKPIAIPLPRDTDPELRRSLQRLEETLRANNALIEQTINEIIKEINDGDLPE